MNYPFRRGQIQRHLCWLVLMMFSCAGQAEEHRPQPARSAAPAAPSAPAAPAFRQPAPAAPAFRQESAPAFRQPAPAAPAFRQESAPAFRQPHESAPAFSSAPIAPASRGAPNAPIYRPNPPAPAPSYRPTTPTPGFQAQPHGAERGFAAHEPGHPEMNREGGRPDMGRVGVHPEMGREGGRPEMGREGGHPDMGRAGIHPEMGREGGHPEMGRAGMNRGMERERHEFREHDVHRFNHEDWRHWRGGRWINACYAGRCGNWWYSGGQFYFYDQPIYPYPMFVSPIAYIDPMMDMPVVQPQQQPMPIDSGPQYWYYCDNPPGYYPYISECYTQFRAVPAY